jgi:hypothetical protein
MIDEAGATTAGSHGQEILPAQFGAKIERSSVPSTVPRSTPSPIENSP